MKATFFFTMILMGIGLISSTPIDKTPENSGIDFFKGTWEEALAKSEKEGKPIFLDAYASWCGPCKVLKARVFTDEEVGSFYNENFINVKIDMEKGEGPSLARKYRVSAYPSLFFIDKEGAVIKKAVGYHNKDQIIQLGKIALAEEGV